jgi:tRNA G18 (ribose-2'-O)-methylase SpoU
MGNVYSMPWTRARGIEDILRVLREHHVVPVALTLADDAITLDALAAMRLERLAFVFGTEGAGVHPKTEGQVDHRVLIPMEPGVDSLNVAAATAVTFYATR